MLVLERSGVLQKAETGRNKRNRNSSAVNNGRLIFSSFSINFTLDLFNNLIGSRTYLLNE